MGKRFNFWRDVVSPTEAIAGRVAKTIAPVSKPLISALTQKALGQVATLGAPVPMKKGGMVKPKGNKKTQHALLHKGELVIPAKHVKSISKALKNKIKKEGGRDMK